MYFDKNFNLIENISDDVEVCFKPISKAFFERHYAIFRSLAGRINSLIDKDGGALIQQTALLDLKDIAKDKYDEIINELERTILVSVASKDKEAIPLSVARKSKFIDSDDDSLILNTIIFFSCLLLGILPKNEDHLKYLLESSSIQSTSLSYTEWRKSSETSKEKGTIEQSKKTSTPTS